MPVYKKKIENEALTGIWIIEETESDLLRCFENNKAVLLQIEAARNESRRCEMLAVRALLKELTGEEKTICYQTNGKPVLSDNSFHISISHTKGFAAVILHPSKQIGIDIERISDQAYKLKSRFTSIKEREAIDNRDEPVVSLLHWSAKETMFKMLSQEGIDFAKHLNIHPFKLTDNHLDATESFTSNLQSFSIQFEITDRYVLTSCIL
jgi:phosphopantetheinyl transferase